MALVVGPMIGSQCHRHFASQLIVAASGRFSIRSRAQDDWSHCAAAWVPSRAWHQTADDALPVLMAYLHPQSAAARGLQHLAGPAAHWAALPAGTWPDLAQALSALPFDPDQLREAVEAPCRAVGQPTARPLDPRVQWVLQRLDADPSLACMLTQLARDVHLSETRLRHLFRSQVGLPLAAYRLWARLMWAVRHVARTQDLTAAAHEAGFHDSAHLSHAFRQIFGLRPSDIFKSSGLSIRLCD